MTAPAPSGHTSTDPRAAHRETKKRDAGMERALDIPATQEELHLRTGRRVSPRAIKRLYGYFLAQADHAADFMTWITYQDPTGEHATNAVLRDQAKEMSTWQ